MLDLEKVPAVTSAAIADVWKGEQASQPKFQKHNTRNGGLSGERGEISFARPLLVLHTNAASLALPFPPSRRVH